MDTSREKFNYLCNIGEECMGGLSIMNIKCGVSRDYGKMWRDVKF